MMYFIPWVLFLLGVILAVPIASWLEKRKYAIPKSVPEDDASDAEEVMADENAEPAEFEEEPGIVSEAAFDAPGGDDLSAFEDDFK